MSQVHEYLLLMLMAPGRCLRHMLLLSSRSSVLMVVTGVLEFGVESHVEV